MREIKFRAWDNLEKRTRKVVSLHWQGDKLVSARLEGDNEPIPIEGRLVIEQSTGLKDKHGAEICEGDIIQFEFWNEKYYRQIAYNSAIASYEAITVASPTSKALRQKAKYSFSELYKISSKGFEVVGNIHENPELLEEK